MREIKLYFYIIMHNVIWTNQNTESFVYHWLRALTKLDRLSCICQSIKHHFKHFVDTLISEPAPQQPADKYTSSSLIHVTQLIISKQSIYILITIV